MTGPTTTIQVTDADRSALRRGIESDFGEGMLQEWPRLSVLRAIGIDEHHYLWEYVVRDLARDASATPPLSPAAPS